MSPYFDPRGLVLLIVRTSASHRAWYLVHQFEAPFQLTPLHQLTLQAALYRQVHEPDKELSDAARIGLREWHNRLAEEVFQIRDPDWAAAYDLAIGWTEQYPGRPPNHGNLLHVALAKTMNATVLFSLDHECERGQPLKGCVSSRMRRVQVCKSFLR